MKASFIFVGPINRGKVPTGGQIAKCQQIIDYFDTQELEYLAIDTFNKSKVLVVIQVLFNSLIYRRAKILLVLSSKSAYYTTILLYLSNSLNRSGYMIIGNWFPIFYNKIRLFKTVYNRYKLITIEGVRTCSELSNEGLTKILPFPNFKYIYDIGPHYLESHLNRTSFKFIFLARVCQDKGIYTAIKAVNQLNKLYDGKIQISLDVYGKVDPAYQGIFVNLLNENNFVEYKGLIDLNSKDAFLNLAKKGYYALLFPSKYKGEGFAGTFIDAMILGLPVIASDWNLNSEIIVHGEHGLVFNFREVNGLENEMRILIQNQVARNSMANNQFKRRFKYSTDRVMSEIMQKLIT